MSFTFSRALVEASLRATCSDADASAPSNSTPTPELCWWPDKTTEHSRLSRFGMTFGPLTANHGAAVLMWWLEASHARTSASQTPTAKPTRATDWTASDPACGASSRGSFAKFDPGALRWRTAQGCLLSETPGSPEFSETWPRWGLMRAGECWELPEWVPPMNGTASGSVPTPVASMSKGSSPGALTRKSGRSRARDRLDHYVMSIDGGPLSPEYAEWLMGWPIGLTDLKPLETDRFRQWQQLHGESSNEPGDTTHVGQVRG
jgi:hypothetical protein